MQNLFIFDITDFHIALFIKGDCGYIITIKLIVDYTAANCVAVESD